MSWLSIVLVGAALAGCATHHAARVDQGYASYGEPTAVKKIDDADRERTWSVRDFMYPHGLVW